MNWCRDENIPIYTIAFGQYDGSIAILKKIAEETKAESYSAKNPEDLIEILYGIFQNNLFIGYSSFPMEPMQAAASRLRVFWTAFM